MSVNLDRYDKAIVHVTTDLPDAGAEVIRVSTLISESLKKHNLFQKDIVPDKGASQPNVLLIKVVILTINRTDDVERIALGKVARSNEVTAGIALIDSYTDTQLAEFTLEGISPQRTGILVEWPWGSVDKAMMQISDQLIKKLSDWSRSSD